MAEVIQFETPIQADPGATYMDLAQLTIVLSGEKLVKIVLQETDPSGEFVPNGKTITIRHEDVAATAFLVPYASLFSTIKAQLVAGSNLPATGEVVDV